MKEKVTENGKSSALVTTDCGIVYDIDFARCVPGYYVAFAEDDEDGAIVIEKDEFTPETQEELDRLIGEYSHV